MCQFLFCGQESKQRIFYRMKNNLYFLSFLWLNLLILIFLMFRYHFFNSRLYYFLKSFFDFLLLLITCPCHAFSQLLMKIVSGDCGHIRAWWEPKLFIVFFLFQAVDIPPVVFGQRTSGFLQISDALILQEDQS